MVRWSPRALSALPLLAYAALSPCATVAHAQNRLAAAVTTTPTRSVEGAVSVTWVFRTADVVACETPAAELRRLQHEYGATMQLTVVYLGSDTAVAHSFLRKERFGGVSVEQVNERRVRREFDLQDGYSLPVLVISTPGAPRRILSANVRTAEGRRDVDRLGSELSAMLSRTTMSRDMALTFHRGGEP